MKIDSQSSSPYPQYSRYTSTNHISTNNNHTDINKISSTKQTPQNHNNNPSSSTNDLVICIDNDEQANNPNMSELLGKLSNNLELDSSKKQLELEEKRVQISMLQEDKLHRSELNKHELLQKNFDLKKKTSELEYTNKLRDLLIEAINSGDFHKCSYLNLCLNNQHTDTTSLFDINNTKNALSSLSTNQYLNSIQLDGLRNNGEFTGPESVVGGNNGSSNGADEDLTQYNNMDNFSDETSFIDDGNNLNNNSHGLDPNVNMNSVTEMANQFNYDENENDLYEQQKQDMLKHLDSQQLAALTSLGLDKNLNLNKNAPYKLNTYLLGNRNIRHMICSSNKLEEYSNSAALKILFKGKCTDNDMCRRKEVHTHYLIDTTDCRRHISLYFQSSKYGLKFFKTYQIKSQGELEKIIRTFKMKLVN